MEQINYNIIQKEYPKSWDELYKHFYNIYDIDGTFEVTSLGMELLIGGDGVYEILNIRDLYEFFDSFSIYIRIIPQPTAELNDRGRFMYGLSGYKNYWQKTLTMYDGRLKCEVKAFMKAFEYLEKMLNNK